MTLQEFFKQYPKTAMGFSGGVDSVYLLYMAKQCGADVKAYYVNTVFQPEFELEDAKRAAKLIGVDFTILDYDILQCEDVTSNPSNRCYYCKKKIFGGIAARAKEDGYEILLDGTNASDDASDRPGMKALTEMEVLSPLRLCGLTKPQIRRNLKEAGIFTWKKPAYACLATRIEAGTRITGEDLQKVEQGEQHLFDMGFRDFRIRLIREMALIQIQEEQMEQAVRMQVQINTVLGRLFSKVVLDMQPRMPSVDLNLEKDKNEQLPILTGSVIKLSCNVDDMTGEEMGFAMERVLEAGALDFYSIPIYMKKNRPAYMLECICRPQDEQKMAKQILKHTTTLGIRREEVSRYCLERTTDSIDSPYGAITVKHSSGYGIEKSKAEYDNLASAARENKKSLQEIKASLKEKRL